MGFFKFEDAISGQEARAYITIDGRNEELFYAKKIEAKIEKEKAEGKTLGKRGTQSKAKGWKGTGTLTIYYATSLFIDLMLKYVKTGVDTYFDIMVINEDPTSSLGKQTVVLKHCNFNDVTVAAFDTDADFLSEDMAFTFSDIDLLNKFNNPTLG
ncbi:phage tail tube protein [Desnuesiella massiliensis]|uniref:phage tail tube protein n=1 Tax=Desnuesiella massiliensis TaxID=1650662 RepID=UPI0006E1738B|nr:phage tail tube protein [Desnuesiella massiliensis]